MNNEPKAGMNLDPEMLAAYIDKRLAPEQRAEVEAQLANDPDNYAVLVETIKALDEIKVPGVPMVPGVPKVRRWVLGAGVLAAAAATLLVVLQPDLLQRLRGDRPDPRFERLVAAVGEERYFDARLSGGFRYGQVRSATRGSGGPAQNLALVAAAGALQQQAGRDPSPTNLHAWGVAQLLLGMHDDAVRTLLAANEAAPGDAALWNDLAGAYLARAADGQHQEDIPRALEAAERAKAAKPNLIESWFNIALALEGMNLQSRAREAWVGFLEQDGGRSLWSETARRRIEAIDRAAVEERRQGRIFTLERWLADGAAGLADALRDGDRAASTRLIDELRISARQVSDAGDRLPLAFTEWLARRSADDPAQVESMLRLLSQAAEASRQNRYEEAGQIAARAVAVAAESGSPVDFAALRFRVNANYLGGKLADVMAAITDALPKAEAAGFHRVQVQLLALLGAIHFSRGDYDRARRVHESAIALCEAIGDRDGLATARIVLAENLRFLGEHNQAWKAYMAALRDRRYLTTESRSFTVLTSASLGALNEGAPYIAIHLATEALNYGRQLNVAAYVTESAYILTKALHDVGRHRDASAEMDVALATLEQVSDRAMKLRLGAELHLIAAQIALAGNPDVAVREAETSRALWRALSTQQRETRLLTLLARAHRDLGNAERAESMLTEAVHLTRTQSGRVEDRFLRLTFMDDVWDPLAAMVDWQIQAGRADRALQYLQFGLGPRRTDEPSPNHVSRSDSTAVVTYFTTADRLVIWLQHGDRTPTMATREIGEAALRHKVAGLRRAIDGTDGAAIDTAAATLAADVLWPISSQLSGVREVFVVADPLMQRVPFAILPAADADRAPLMKRVSVALCADALNCGAALPVPGGSATTVSALYSVGGGDGGSALPSTRSEAERIASLYSRASVQPATRNEVKLALSSPGIVHYAGHAFLNPERPWLSSLSIDEGTEVSRVPLQDLLPEQVAARVVVLSACSTVSGERLRGQGVLGIASELLRRGAREAIGTLWDVEDAAFARVVFEVHQSLASGLSSWESVRQAQLSAAAEGEAPRHWAGLVAIDGGGFASVQEGMSR